MHDSGVDTKTSQEYCIAYNFCLLPVWILRAFPPVRGEHLFPRTSTWIIDGDASAYLFIDF
jgi:hypothetical protein